MNLSYYSEKYNFDIYEVLEIPSPKKFFELCFSNPKQIIFILWKSIMLGRTKKNEKKLKACILYACNKRETPFTQAAKACNLDLFNLLLDSTQCRTSSENRIRLVVNAIHEAIIYEPSGEIFNFILEHHANHFSSSMAQFYASNTNIFGGSHFTSIVYCINYKRYDLLKHLINFVNEKIHVKLQFVSEFTLLRLLIELRNGLCSKEIFTDIFSFIFELCYLDITQFKYSMRSLRLLEFLPGITRDYDGLIDFIVETKMESWVIRLFLHSIKNPDHSRIRAHIIFELLRAYDMVHYDGVMTFLSFFATRGQKIMFNRDHIIRLCNYAYDGYPRRLDAEKYRILYALSSYDPEILDDECFLRAYKIIIENLGSEDLSLRAETLFDQSLFLCQLMEYTE